MPPPRQDTDHGTEAKTLPIRLGFNLPEDLPYITCVRQTTSYVLKSVGVCTDDASDLEMMIGELATNVVRHSKDGNYSVTIELHGNQAEIIVADQGVGFDPRTVPDAGTLRIDELPGEHLTRFGGFGLPLVYSLADDVIVEPNHPQGTVIRARKQVRCSY